MSKGNYTIVNTPTLNNNTDATNFAKNGISTYPLNIIVLGDLNSQSGDNEEETAQRLINEKINESLWLQPQVIMSGKEFNSTVTIIDAQLNFLVFDNYSRASLSFDSLINVQEDIMPNTSITKI